MTYPDIVYPINEIFETIQGEASFTGTPSLFIRLQGCNVGCPWCDTKHTWSLDANCQIPLDELINKNSDKVGWAYFNIDQIEKLVQTKFPIVKHVVITGGEPALYDLKPMCLMLEKLGKTVQIETSGTEKLNIFNFSVPLVSICTVLPNFSSIKHIGFKSYNAGSPPVITTCLTIGNLV